MKIGMKKLWNKVTCSSRVGSATGMFGRSLSSDSFSAVPLEQLFHPGYLDTVLVFKQRVSPLKIRDGDQEAHSV